MTRSVRPIGGKRLKGIRDWLVVVAAFIALIAWCTGCMSVAAYAVDRLQMDGTVGGILMLAAVFGGLWFALWTTKRIVQP